jgi:hypothetical protein
METAAALAGGGPAVERHLARCPACRATAAALAVVQRAGEMPARAPSRDLWPRLRARLAEREDAARVYIRLPVPGWRAAAALAAIVVATSVAPEPGRLLAVMLGML